MVIIVTLLFAPPVTFGQTRGLLKGQISDNANAGIDWAKVIVTKGSEKHELKVDKDGKYEIVLPEGDYVLIGQAKAFRPSNEIKVKVAAGQTTEINLSLDINLDNAVCLLLVEGFPEKHATENKEKQKAEMPEKPIKEKQNKPPL